MIWLFVAIAFVAGEADGNQVFGAKTKEKCEEFRAKVQEALVTNKDVQFVVTECQAIKVPEVPKFKKERDS